MEINVQRMKEQTTDRDNKGRLKDLLSQIQAITSMFKNTEKDETAVLVKALTHGRKTFTSKHMG